MLNLHVHPHECLHKKYSRTLRSCICCCYHRELILALLKALFKVESSPIKSVGAWDVETGGHDCISDSGKKYIRHLSRVHRTRMFPETCAKRVKILTDSLVRMDAYPAAYGGFSDIWSCQLRGKKSPPKRVAVKVIRRMNAEEYPLKLKAIDQELEVWAQLEHPNVLPLYGVADGFGPFPAFVSPWADHGTLSEYLEKFESGLDLRKRLQLLCDIATGLNYLHSRHVVHGDLSGSNVLVTKGGQAVISDFGLSIRINTTESGCSFPGNIRWAAPELFDACVGGRSALQLASRQADVYSFGSVMFQILTGKIPFHGIQRVAQIVIMISQGSRPAREPCWDGDVIPNALWRFVEECWASPPSERPSCKNIVTFIKHEQSGLFKEKRRSPSATRAPRRRFRRTPRNQNFME